MTKLQEWLSVLLVSVAIYVSLITRQIQSELIEPWMFHIQIFPIVAIGLFGVSREYYLIVNCYLAEADEAIHWQKSY